MTRIMYDGIGADANNIRYIAWHPGDLVAYYVLPNRYAWTAQQLALFPPSTAMVSITVDAGVGADVFDIESGAGTPAQAFGWIQMMKGRGYWKPTIYCNMSTVGSVIALTGKYVHGVDYDIWIADWDGTATDPLPYAVAKQAQSTQTWDKSYVYDDQWPRREPPAPPVVTQPAHLSGEVTLTWTRPGGVVDHYVLGGPHGIVIRLPGNGTHIQFSYFAGLWSLHAIIPGHGPALVTSFTLP